MSDKVNTRMKRECDARDCIISKRCSLTCKGHSFFSPVLLIPTFICITRWPKEAHLCPRCSLILQTVIVLVQRPVVHNTVTHRSLRDNAVASNDVTQLLKLSTEFQWCLVGVKANYHIRIKKCSKSVLCDFTKLMSTKQSKNKLFAVA